MANNFIPKILSIITNTPKNKFLQNELLTALYETGIIDKNDTTKKYISDIYNNSKISSRYLTSLEFLNKKVDIDERFNAFKLCANEIIIDMARQALEQSKLTNHDIHKIIFVSSTGLYAPCIDIEIIKQLNLPNTIERSNIFFMGCSASINAIKNACEYLKANQNTNVMIVSVELSSVHINFSEEINNVITHSIFSDGLSVSILSSGISCVNQLNDFSSELYIIDSFNYLINNSEDGIRLFIEDNSIQCKLSKNLPKYISENILHALTLFLNKNNLTMNDIGFWAVHPGGKRILESVQNGLNLPNDKLDVSWDILYNFGNMLSSSIMFVLEKFMNTNHNTNDSHIFCVAFSFSPGVGIEIILLKKIYKCNLQI
jgi:alpha-pyrone synthase